MMTISTEPLVESSLLRRPQFVVDPRISGEPKGVTPMNT